MGSNGQLFDNRVLAVMRSGREMPGATESFPADQPGELWPEGDFFFFFTTPSLGPRRGWSARASWTRCRAAPGSSTWRGRRRREEAGRYAPIYLRSEPHGLAVRDSTAE